MRGFSGAKRCEPLDLGDLTVEIVATFHLLRSLWLINSGPNSAEVLWYLSTNCYDIRVFPRSPTVSRFLSLCKVSDVYPVSA